MSPIEVDITIPQVSIIVEVPMKIISSSGECPVITVINGGNASSVYVPVNGNIVGGGA